MPSRRASSRSRLVWLKNFAQYLRTRSGWRRYALAAAYGAFSSLAYAPADVAPVLWIAYPALIFLLQGTENARQAFSTGWCFAFGFFVLDLYWTAVSMFVDIGHFWWAVPLAACGLPAFFAIYYGLAAALARWIGLRGASGAIVFALLWFLADYVRGHFLTGFPWNMEGYAWADFAPVLQITSVIGVYGLTLLTLLVICLPASLAEEQPSALDRSFVIAGFVMFALLAAWGGERLASASNAVVPGVLLRLVQPDVAQELKWRPEDRERNFARLLALTSAAGEEQVTAVIWPETASPFYLTLDEEHRREAAAVAPRNGSIITGVLRAEADPALGTRYYNSLIAIDSHARITAVYDKSHLVPFGEYIPFRQWVPLPAIAGLGVDFSHGNGPQTLRAPGLPPFSPLICYEVIFPGEVVNRGERPQLLLNVTNDGWYGRTAGPYQHFAIARVRAVEEGLPLVRAANTGISGIVDAYGRIEVRLGLGRSGFIDGKLPQAIAPTVFSRAGNRPLWLIFLFAAVMAVCGRSAKRKT